MAEGKEGDWECSGCNNRNYGFRSICNRCKQPRLLVDTHNPNSKWLPRIGDWICTGCTNNNYASRDKCNKCGQPKDVAVPMPGVFVPGHPNMAWIAHHQSLLPPTSTWPFPLPFDHLSTPAKGWRNGDWICNCGFHNYSSRTQCKQCNATFPVALGVKRLASDELVHDCDSKRLNAGAGHNVNHYMQSYSGFIHDQSAGLQAAYSSRSAAAAPSMQVPTQLQTAPTLIGKGAKQWRDGDWMCSNCSNHNYASRSECNRCKTQKIVSAQPVGVA